MIERRMLLAAAACAGLVALTGAGGCGGPSVTLDGEPFRVVHVSPSHGAIEVAIDVVPLVGFSVPLAEGEEADVALVRLDVEPALAVEVSRFVIDGGLVIELLPRQALAGGGVYEITAPGTLVSEDGATLEAPLRARFACADAEGG